MANKNFTQFALSSYADPDDFIVGYGSDGAQELRYNARDIRNSTYALGLLTAGNFDFKINGVTIGRGPRSLFSTNVVFGNNAGTNITSGDANVAIGYHALSANKTSSFNVAIGYQPLYSHTFGSDNTAIGTLTLTSLTGGNSNTAVGALLS